MTLVMRDMTVLLAAPHGGFDLSTDEIVPPIAVKLNYSQLVAIGYRAYSHPINVNRPTEGIGLQSDDEKRTDAAAKVYAEWEGDVLRVDPDLYIEVHGEGKSTDIEVAVVGFNSEQEAAIKKILSAALAPLYFKTNPQIKVEGIDNIHFSASAAKKYGILGKVHRALHIELPWDLRRNEKENTIAFLIKALPAIKQMR
jgi:hypothetical protein